MADKIAFLFAGQGSQKTGMGLDFYNGYPEFKRMFDNISLAFDLKEACFQNPNDLLLQTQYTQPCMVSFACGITQLLYSKNIYPDYVCGLSLGEYSALYAAGVWSLEDTMKIISARGKAMAEASAGIETAMVAIVGAEESVVASACEKAIEAGIVSVCNINCPGQIVIGGAKNAVDLAVEYVKESGIKRCIPLAVSGPFHTEYMKPAGEALEKVLNGVTYNEPRCEVLFNYLGGPNLDNISIVELLKKQVQHTVRMKDCLEYLINQGVTNFIEIGPGTALSGFVKKTLKALDKNTDGYRIISINNVEDLQHI